MEEDVTEDELTVVQIESNASPAVEVKKELKNTILSERRRIAYVRIFAR